MYVRREPPTRGGVYRASDRNTPRGGRFMRGRLSVLIAALTVAISTTSLPQAAAPRLPVLPAPPQTSDDYRAVLNQYCVTCHNERLKTAGLTLDKMNVADIPAGAEVWEKVIRKVRVG